MERKELVCDCNIIHEDAVNMAIKNRPDDKELINLSELFKIFGDSTRIKIINILIGEEQCVNEISDKINVSQSAVSHQLRILKASKLVKYRKEGNMNLPNRNYLLRFRNMKNPNQIIINYQNKKTVSNYYIEKNDLMIRLNDINVYEPIEVSIIGNNLEIETISVINEEIEGILDDLEINTILKEKIDDIIFSELTVKKKRIGLRKLKKQGLEPKFINMFIGLLEFIDSK